MACLKFDLLPDDNERLGHLCGQFDEHLAYIESRLAVQISRRGSHFQVSGRQANAQQAQTVIKTLYEAELPITHEEIHLQIQSVGGAGNDTPEQDDLVVTRKVPVKPRGKNQCGYVRRIKANDLSFGIGPAGTGKTYLAVACAVSAFF